MATAAFDGELDYGSLWAGESCAVVDDVLPAVAIVHRLAEDAAAAPRGSP